VNWYLGPHRDAALDTTQRRSAIGVDGRIAGECALDADGEVLTKFLEDVGRDRSRSAGAEAARLTDWLPAAKVVPRFPTPLHKELIG
jgi:hypothetical protein